MVLHADLTWGGVRGGAAAEFWSLQCQSLGLGTAHLCLGAGWRGVLGIVWLLLIYLSFITSLKRGPHS